MSRLDDILAFVTYTKSCKAALKSAIEAQGVDIEDSATLDTYATRVAEIAGGGGTVYTVQYLDWDGIILKSQQVLPGGDVNPPSNPPRPGYNFTGWDISGINVQSDLIITAQYVYSPNLVVALDYDLSLISLMNYSDGDDININDPVRENLVFTGWSDSLLNVQGNRALIATYDTNPNAAYAFITLTPETGLSPTFNISQWYTGPQIQMYFGDGSSQSTGTVTGNIRITHTYPAYGEYKITFIRVSDIHAPVGAMGSGSGAFLTGSYARALTKVYLGAISMIQGAFAGTGISSAVLNSLLQSAFANCLNLKNIVIEDGISTHYDYIFYGCTNLEKVVFLDKTLSTFGAHIFDNVPLTCEIYVPDESVSAYVTALSAYSLPIRALSTLPEKYQ